MHQAKKAFPLPFAIRSEAGHRQGSQSLLRYIPLSGERFESVRLLGEKRINGALNDSDLTEMKICSLMRIEEGTTLRLHLLQLNH